MIEALIGGGLGLVGQLLSGMDRAKADAILQQARDEFGRIVPAKVKQLVAEQLGPSALGGLQQGPEYGAEADSLARYGNEIQAGGMGIQDRAALNDALDTVGQQERAQRQGIEDRFAARGAMSGGQSLLSQLVAQQGGAQRAQRAGMDAAAEAQRRYWQAVRERAGLAGSMYGQRAHEAEAKDAIARWNLGHRYDVDRENNRLRQQEWENKFRQTAGKAGMDQAAAGRADATADRTAQMWGRLGEAGAQAYGQYQDDERRRNRPASDPSEWSNPYGGY